VLEAVVDTATVRATSRRVRVISRGCGLTVWVDQTPQRRTDELGRGVWARKHGAFGDRLLPPNGWCQIVDSTVRLGREELRRRAVRALWLDLVEGLSR
jgi:hypothetical protein